MHDNNRRGHADDPVGYVWDGTTYCSVCFNHEYRDDADTEWKFAIEGSDSPLHCFSCGELIPSELTARGYQGLAKRIRNFEFEERPDLFEEYLRYWSWLDWYVIPTFTGMMDPFGNIKVSW